MKVKPAISVLLSVYNGEKFLNEAIDSILKQTFTNFEFLIINDGSNDKTIEIIESYHDPRIRLINNKTNLGLAASLNKGLRLAKGKFVARIDQDDICFPQRFEKQIVFLLKNPEIDVCGSYIRTFDQKNSYNVPYPQTHNLIKCKFLFRNAIVHPSVMIRRKSLVKNHLYYDPNYKNSEDYELWTRSISQLKFANIPSILILYRVHKKQLSNNFQEKKYYSNIARQQYLKKNGITATSKEISLHHQIALEQYNGSEDFINRGEKWLTKIKQINYKKIFFDNVSLCLTLEEYWFRVCNNATHLTLATLKKYFFSELFYWSKISVKHLLIMITKLILSPIITI